MPIKFLIKSLSTLPVHFDPVRIIYDNKKAPMNGALVL